MFITFSSSLFFLFLSPFQLCIIFSDCQELKQSQVPWQVSLADVVTVTGATPSHWTFYFKGSWLPLFFTGTWSNSMHKDDIVLLELQVVVLILQ